MMADIIKEKLSGKKTKDIKVLAGFVDIFCREQHKGAAKSPFAFKPLDINALLKRQESLKLCSECNKLLAHGAVKLLLCPYDPKPKCKDCAAHCYAPGYRERIKKVMKFSGIYMIKRGRLDLLAHFI